MEAAPSTRIPIKQQTGGVKRDDFWGETENKKISKLSNQHFGWHTPNKNSV